MAGSQESDHRDGIAPLATLFKDCLNSFERLCAATAESQQVGGELLCSTVHGCFSKFRMWGNDTGAPDGSLDYALRKSSHLQQTTKDLLGDLISTLCTMCENVEATHAPSLSNKESSLSSQPDGAGLVMSRRASSDSDTSLQQSADDVEEIVNCLIKLIPALQDPAPQDIYSKQASPDEAKDDIELVAKFFPKASSLLTNRLGFANWKRKQFVQKLNSRNHPDESSKQIPSGKKNNGNGQELSTSLDNSRSDYQTRFSSHRTDTGRSSTSSTSVVESIFSQPAFSAGHSVASFSDSDTMAAWNQDDTPKFHYEIPKPPVVLGSRSTFDCPYCGQTILFGVQITSEEDWAQHVFKDLEPYQCTFDGCVRADKMFGIREEWFQHELDYHRLLKVWFCQACAHEFDQREPFEIHLREKHKTDSSHLPVMVSLCQRYSEKTIPRQNCPFCGTSSMAPQQLKEHVADHMEQLALMTIQNEVGSDIYSASIEAVGIYKTELIKDFIKKQQDDYFMQPVKGPADDSTDDPAPFFADDSEDEAVDVIAERPIVKAGGVNRTVRPSLRRNPDSYTRKVSSYLQSQQTNSKVEKFLDTQSELGDQSNIPAPLDPPDHHLTDDTSQLQDLVAPLPPFRTKPPPRNEDFVGRAEDLTKIHSALSVPGNVCVLSGVGGIGKTETAIEYSYRYEGAYSHIFWVNAESAVSCMDSYSLIATHLIVAEDDMAYEQSRLTTLGREFLEQTETRWLIVFDNVNIWSDILEYLPTDPHRTHGSILITARKSNLNFLASLKCQSIELGALNLEEGRQLLLLSMQPNLDPRHLRSHPEYKLAGEIATLAERLPLALAHIAGYLQVSKCTLTDFVQLWNERRRHTKALAQPSIYPVRSTDRALETVWNIGLREVTIDARELLNILAFLDSETIQRNLLVGEHEEPLLDFLHSHQTFRYKRMITELSCRRLILVKDQDGQEILSIHRSLQQKILEDIDKDAQKREEVFAQAFSLVRKRFPLPSPIQVPEPEKWPVCKDNLPHVLRLQTVVTENLPSILPSVEVARLLSDGGINLWERGMTNEGLRLLRSAEAILDQLKSDESQLRANIHIIIALLIQDYGFSYIAESKDRIEKALQIRKDHLSHTRPYLYTRDHDILLHNAWSDYGCVLLQYNKHIEAEPIFRRCLVKYHEWGNETEIPYEYYKFNHHTAFCRLYHGDFAEAIKLAEEGLRMVTLATGQSSATSKTRFDLACIVLQSGDLTRALELHQQVLKSNLKQHGKFSFLTLQSYYAVGALHAYRGELADAERIMSKALSLESMRKGSWPEAAVARTEFHLSQILTQQGKDLDEAQQLASRARAVLAHILPLNPLDCGSVEAADELALFDHVQPVFDGRFTGRTLLKYVSKHAS
ncbi:hypothetical protein MMC07_005986 [Pseudocyphellaria aurata]|nr:hypothetical protein [Pseudocyphellaria aurata]